MRFKESVKAIMKQNLNAFYASGDPDLIYRFLSAALLECAPADLLFLHDLFKREVANETDTSTDGLNALTERFFSGLHDVLFGILAERIHEFKDANDFLPLGQILKQTLSSDPKILHEVGQLVYHDYYATEVIERANNSVMNKFHNELKDHFQKIQNSVRVTEEQVDAGTLDGYPDWYQPVLAEMRLLNLLDVVNCYNDASLVQSAPSDSVIKMEDE